MDDTAEKCRDIILQVIALVAINILGFCYDSTWLYACIAVDLIVLGIDLDILHKSKQTGKST